MLLRGKTKTGTRSVNNNGDPLQLDNNLLVGNNGDSSSAGPQHLQGVPQLSSHFVLLVFSASHAHTEVHFTIFQQPRRRRFQNSPYFPPYIKN